MSAGTLILVHEADGRAWSSSGPLRVGRDEANDVRLTRTPVSRRHAEILPTRDGWLIRDLVSRNGTFVDDQLVPPAGVILHEGGLLYLAGERLRVVSVAGPSPAFWAGCRYPSAMLRCLGHVDWAVPALGRKLRLWGVACLRTGHRPDSIVDTLQDDYLDYLHERIEAALVALERIELSGQDTARGREGLFAEVRGDLSGLEGGQAALRLFAPSGCVADFADAASFGRMRDDPECADLLRCALGDPWHQPALDPAWLAWEGGQVPALAEGIVRDESLAGLPVLGDALEEAGCADGRLLAHLRSPGPHCRGCHTLDAVLGRHPSALLTVEAVP